MGIREPPAKCVPAFYFHFSICDHAIRSGGTDHTMYKITYLPMTRRYLLCSKSSDIVLSVISPCYIHVTNEIWCTVMQPTTAASVTCPFRSPIECVIHFMCFLNSDLCFGHLHNDLHDKMAPHEIIFTFSVHFLMSSSWFAWVLWVVSNVLLCGSRQFEYIPIWCLSALMCGCLCFFF